MNTEKEIKQEMNTFIDNWTETAERNKEIFLHFQRHLSDKEGVLLTFIPRPGVTYSLRASHTAQKKKELFVMVDVIEDTPRWLSVCFYGEMISNPEQKGDFVPGGLLGEDAICFDIEQWNEELIHYVEMRLDEAWENAAREQGN
jgi:hypothetical protein